MIRAIFWFLLLVTFNVANAECILRTTSLTKVVGKINDISDLKTMVSPALKGERVCSISARVLYKGAWFTVMDSYTGPPEVGDDELCVNATEIAVRRFLATKETKLMHNEEQMVCSDEPAIKTGPVKIGEVVPLSALTPDPAFREEFQYKGSTCRKFVETSYSINDLYQWHGIVCKVGRADAEQWVVVDKF